MVPSASRAAGEELTGRAIICAVRDERDVSVTHAAAALASALGQGLVLAHVVAGTSGRTPAGPTPDGREAAYRMLEAIARPIAVTMARVIELRVLEGAGGPQLDRLAVAEDASMVAVGSSARGPLVAALAGSPSRHLMRHGARPVLIYPPGRRARRRSRQRVQIRPAAFAWQGRA